MEILSVIIPVKNRWELLVGTLRSIASQCEVPAGTVELLFVDNGSDDAVVENVRHWIDVEAPRWMRVGLLRETGGGVCAARNRGLAAARGEWVMFFDSDDLMAPQHLKSVTEAVATTGKSCDVIYWDVAYCRAGGSRGIHRAKGIGGVCHNVIIRGVLSTQRYCCRRRFMTAAGGWDERLEVWNDWELSVRLLAKEARIVYRSGAPTVTVIEHDDSITGPRFTERSRQREKSLGVARDVALSHGMNRASALIDMKGAVLAGDYAREGERELSAGLLSELDRHGTVALWKLCLIAETEKAIGRGASVITWLLG